MAPPVLSAASRTTTLRPFWASSVAAVRPLWPPPMTMASKEPELLGFISDDVMGRAHFSRFAFHVAQDFSSRIAAGGTHDATAGMGGGAAEIEAGNRRPVLRITGHRAVEK